MPNDQERTKGAHQNEDSRRERYMNFDMGEWMRVMEQLCGHMWITKLLVRERHGQTDFFRDTWDIALLADEIHAAVKPTGPLTRWPADTEPLRDSRINHLALKMNRYHGGPRPCDHLARQSMLHILEGMKGYPMREKTARHVARQIAMLEDHLRHYERWNEGEEARPWEKGSPLRPKRFSLRRWRGRMA